MCACLIELDQGDLHETLKGELFSYCLQSAFLDATE